MNKLVKSVAAAGLCLVTSAGCKSRLLHSRSEANRKPASAVAESKSEPTEERSLGQASYEQFAADPNASPWGRSPYHFGGSGSTSTGSATTPGAKRC